MTNLFIILLVLFVDICIPSANEEVDSVDYDYTEHGSIFQRSRRNYQKGELYEVPLISLDRLNDLAKVKENEVSLLYHKQTTSLQLSEKVNILSEFQEENVNEFVKLNHKLWVSMTMDCHRNIWMSKLTAFQAKTKRISILPQIKALQSAVNEELDAFQGLVNSTFKMIIFQLVLKEEYLCVFHVFNKKYCMWFLLDPIRTSWRPLRTAVENVKCRL